MKKSISTPSLTSLGKTPPLTKMRRSTSTNAFPAPLEMVGPLLEIVNTEIQMEAVLHVPALHAGSCSIDNHKFPFELLTKDGPLVSEEKALVNCLLEPIEKEVNTRSISRIPQSPSYLDLSEGDPKIAERYAEFLRRVRKGRRRL